MLVGNFAGQRIRPAHPARQTARSASTRTFSSPLSHVLVAPRLRRELRSISRPKRIDYLTEALALERQGDFDAALTSYRLALRDHPNDPRILQNMAIAFSKTGQLDDAVRSYRRALELDPQLSGAHYGLAFCCSSAAISAARSDISTRSCRTRPRAPRRTGGCDTRSRRWTSSRRVTAPRTPRRSSSSAWGRFSQSSARKAALEKPPRRSTSPPRSRGAG